MRYGIMINLDYESYSYEECREIWQQIRTAMVEAGFRIEGRLFTTAESPDAACHLAKAVLDRVNDQDFPDRDIYDCLKEFYGYDHSNTTNLLLPPSEGLEVIED